MVTLGRSGRGGAMDAVIASLKCAPSTGGEKPIGIKDNN
jgi:hypothetical protein